MRGRVAHEPGLRLNPALDAHSPHRPWLDSLSPALRLGYAAPVVGIPGSRRRQRGRSLSRVVAIALLALGCEDDEVLGPPRQGLPTPEQELAALMDAATAPDAARDGGALDQLPEGPCDLTGRWMLQVTTFTTPDTALASGAQKTSTWHYYEVRQQDDAFEVTVGLWCDTRTTGDANVEITTEAKNAMARVNDAAGRRGTYRRVGEQCELEIDRLYVLYSIGPYAKFAGGLEGPPGVLPNEPELSELTALPLTPEDGVEDWDEDGVPGMQWVISDSPLGSGVRHSVQRQWGDMGGRTELGATDFVIDAQWDIQENILDANSPFLRTGATVRNTARHVARWVRTDISTVGKDDRATCRNVLEALPHAPVPRDAYEVP